MPYYKRIKIFICCFVVNHHSCDMQNYFSCTKHHSDLKATNRISNAAASGFKRRNMHRSRINQKERKLSPGVWTVLTVSPVIRHSRHCGSETFQNMYHGKNKACDNRGHWLQLAESRVTNCNNYLLDVQWHYTICGMDNHHFMLPANVWFTTLYQQGTW